MTGRRRAASAEGTGAAGGANQRGPRETPSRGDVDCCIPARCRSGHGHSPRPLACRRDALPAARPANLGRVSVGSCLLPSRRGLPPAAPRRTHPPPPTRDHQPPPPSPRELKASANERQSWRGEGGSAAGGMLRVGDEPPPSIEAPVPARWPQGGGGGGGGVSPQTTAGGTTPPPPQHKERPPHP